MLSQDFNVVRQRENMRGKKANSAKHSQGFLQEI